MALISDAPGLPLNFSQLHRPHILEYAAGFAEVVITLTAHVQCVPVAALQTIRYSINGGTVGLVHLSSGYAGLVGDGISHALGLLRPGVIDNCVPPPGGAQLLMCNVCNLPRPSDIGLCRAVNGATVSDTPKSVFVTITDQVQANGVPPAARSLAISPTTRLYGFDYHLTGAVCNDGSVLFRVPTKRGYNVFQGDVASAQWGMIQKDGRMSVIQGATAHLAMRACVLCYTSERRVSWAAGRHRTFNEFHA